MDIKKYIFVLTAAMSLTACEDMIEIDPPTDALSVEETYSTKEGIYSAFVGLYAATIHENVCYYYVPSVHLSWMSDDMTYYRPLLQYEFIQNQYEPKTKYVSTMWTKLYSQVYQDNDFIAHVQGNSLISETTQKEYIGQALWLRCYDYFWLVNLWGDVPLVLSNNYSETAYIPRTSKEQVWEQIISDLQTSAEYLKETIPNGSKTRVTAEAAQAMLARAYLYTEQWEKAAETASLLIPAEDGGSGTKFQLEDIDNVFLASSKEAIFQANMKGFSGTYIGYTYDGVCFIPSTSTVSYPLTADLVQCIQADQADLRNNWIKGQKNTKGVVEYYPYKYKCRATPESTGDYEYLCFLRLAEQYLIRAEAFVHLGEVQMAVADINSIRLRAGLDRYQGGVSEEALLLEIEEQRRKEFFCEQGHRWNDLKRTGRIDRVLGAASWKKWSPERALLPIPYAEVETNTNLTQNPGYNN